MIVPVYGGSKYRVGVRLDFSETLNPLGTPLSVRNSISGNRKLWQTYPDPDCNLLRKKLSSYENIPAENIVCGNGGDDMIFRIIWAVRPKKAVVCTPSFGEYKRALVQNGCEVKEFKLLPKNNFVLTSDISYCISSDTDIIFLCSPNDPTGEVITPFILGIIAQKCKKTNTVMVCDERFMDYVYRNERLSAKSIFCSNIIIIKSFDKVFSMAGLGLGYAMFGDAELAEKVKNTGPRISVSAAAQAAGIAAAENVSFVKMSRKYVSIERNNLSEKLTELGLPVLNSKANFVMFMCELPLDILLMKKGIRIKNCSESFGTESGYFRAAVRTHKENEELISAIRRILHT